MKLDQLEFTLSGLGGLLQEGLVSPVDIACESLRRIRATGPAPAWITVADEKLLLRRAEHLSRLPRLAWSEMGLYGMPFAVKDNIDVGLLPTTAACPEFAYTPQASASVVERLERAGALCMGKTNLDQFATGLVGVRSPYGIVTNSFDPSFVSGGSSSGSAVAVARGEVAFALGTDTAGSGRVPAAFNNLLGIKPSRGLLSTNGVVPACRTLDCVSVFACDLDTAWEVIRIAAGKDERDPYSRELNQRIPFNPSLRLGVPRILEFFDDQSAAAAFDKTCAQWRDLGAEIRPIDFAPFLQAADLLYQGPWVAERSAGVGDFVAAYPEACDPIVRGIVLSGQRFSATDLFRGQYRLAEIAGNLAPGWNHVDALLVPSTPTIYRIADVQADPVRLNTRLGLYTNFVNLLDLAAIAVPGGFRNDKLPAGFTLIAPAGTDYALAFAAHLFLRKYPNTLGTSNKTASITRPPAPLAHSRGYIRVAVAGAHLSGMPLNHELTERMAKLVAEAETATRYELYALPGSHAKPGLVRVSEGAAIKIELWDVPVDLFGGFVAGVPPPLAIGSVELANGSWVKGFVCEPCALENATDITHYAGWRAYIAAKSEQAPENSIKDDRAVASPTKD